MEIVKIVESNICEAGNLIENLYVLPAEQRKGYGANLLQYVLQQCIGVPSLWILSNNERTNAFYRKYGFIESGKRKQLQNDLFEIGLILCFER